jgi:hypothetical protein
MRWPDCAERPDDLIDLLFVLENGVGQEEAEGEIREADGAARGCMKAPWGRDLRILNLLFKRFKSGSSDNGSQAVPVLGGCVADKVMEKLAEGPVG